MKLRDNEAVQMYCAMLVRGRHDSHGHSGKHVDQVLKQKKKFRHTSKSLRDTVDAYIDGGYGICG